ncbi:MAG: DUF4340 domain-containing protein [Chloroflexota bacterium]
MNTQNTSTTETPAGFSRTNQILLGLIVIQILITAFVFWPQESIAGSRLTVEGFDPETVTQLVITNNDGEQITIKKIEGGWVWPDGDNYPVLENVATDLVEKLTALDTNRLVTRTDASHKRLEVAADDFARQVTLANDNGDSQTIYVGSSPSGGSTHVRLAEQNETYLTGDLNAWQINTQVSNWVETEYFKIPNEDIQTLRLQNTQGDFTFAKDESGEWTLDDLDEGEEFSPTSATSLASRIATLRMVEPVSKTAQDWFAIDQPQATVTVTINNETDGEQTYTIQIGASNEENEYIAKASNSEYYVLVAQFSVSDFVTQARSDFLAEQTEPVTDGDTDSQSSGSE